MMTHEIKLHEAFAEAVLSGDRTFDICFNKDGYRIGDYVKFIILSDFNNEIIDHPLNKNKYIITYILSGWGIKDGYTIFSIRKVEE